MKTIFVHGGPGLNSVADEAMVGDLFRLNGIDVYFWNEPKRYVTDSPYSELCDSLVEFINLSEGQVNVIGHSAGCGFLISVLDRIKKKVSKICFLSPAVDTLYSGSRIIDIALEIYSKTDTSKYNKLTSMVKDVSDVFDENRKNAILFSFGCNYFPQNFIALENFEKYFGYLVGENEFNLDNHFAVIEDIPKYSPKEKFEIPVICFLGERDPVFELAKSKEHVSMAFSNIDFVTISDCSHYPHIENTDKFFASYLNFIGPVV